MDEDLTEDEWRTVCLQVLEDLTTRIKLKQVLPKSLSQTQDFERIEGKNGEEDSFKRGNFRVSLEYAPLIPPEVLPTAWEPLSIREARRKIREWEVSGGQ